MGNLEKFRDQQKMIEELNRRKKEMLTTAIQQRFILGRTVITELFLFRFIQFALWKFILIFELKNYIQNRLLF